MTTSTPSPAWQFWMLCVLALGLLLGGWLAPLWEQSWREEPSPATDGPWSELVLEEAPPATVPFVTSLRVDGYVELMARPVTVHAEVAGTVREVLVEPGQLVEAGEILLRMDAEPDQVSARHRHQAAAALLATTEAKLKTERLKESELSERYERVRSLVAMEAASRQELNEFSYRLRLCRARTEELKAERRLHRAQLAAAAARLGQRDLRAPIRGRLWSLPIVAGSFVEPRGGFPVAVIAPDRQKVVRVLVPEEEAARLRERGAAVAFPLGEGGEMIELVYVRTEREVETQIRLGEEPARFVQVIYRVVGAEVPLVLGQRVEVYLEASKLSARGHARQGKAPA